MVCAAPLYTLHDTASRCDIVAKGNHDDSRPSRTNQNTRLNYEK